MNRPVVGVLVKFFQINLSDDPSNESATFKFYRASAQVNDCLISNGALTFGIFPPQLTQELSDGDISKCSELTKEQKKTLALMVAQCDGVVLPGGLNSNSYEEFVARLCYEKNIPCLGICAGLNNMVRALGGQTIELDENDIHDRPDLEYAHECTILDSNSFLGRHKKNTVFKVNSIHTYVATDVGDKLSVVAVDPDGYAEVVQAKDKLFYGATKFHPELTKDDPVCKNIFKMFIKACNIYKASKEHKVEKVKKQSKPKN